MRFHVVTLFPKAFDSYLGESILKRAIEDKKLKVSFYNPRDFVEKSKDPKIIFLSPRGKQLTNEYAIKIAKKFKDVIIVSGRYEGIDARVKKVFKMEELSVGPFVLTGGELPAMTIIDVVSRQVPGILGNLDSIEERRVSSGEVYTRPEIFKYKGKNYRVPKVLLSGHTAKIEEWKRRKSGKK